jgi:outer membrane immunogenic protein
MKKSTLGALLASVSPVALLVGVPAADAADMAIRKAPPVAAPPPTFSWTGCYVGAHVGWGWGKNNYRESSETNASTTSNFVNGSGNVTSVTSGSSSFSAANGSIDTSGGLFGGQVGCNYQFAGNWVAGIQGDFAGTDINGTGNDPLGVGHAIRVKTEWLASVTARLGLTAFDNLALFYVKGGVAWDRNKWDLSSAANVFNPAVFSESRTGWTVGGGAEWVLWNPHWTAFAEFNYYQFQHGGHNVTGSSSSSTTSSPGFSNGAPIINNTTSTTNSLFQTGSQHIETVKVGVNYKWW